RLTEVCRVPTAPKAGGAVRLEGDGGPAEPSPTIGQYLDGWVSSVIADSNSDWSGPLNPVDTRADSLHLQPLLYKPADGSDFENLRPTSTRAPSAPTDSSCNSPWATAKTC